MSLTENDSDSDSESDRDPLIEALVRDVDMSLVLRNLKLAPQQRMDQLIELQHFAAALAEAGRKARVRE
ncbi:MAG: hypothetical protein ABUL67_01035 [Haliangium ochraceum]